MESPRPRVVLITGDAAPVVEQEVESWLEAWSPHAEPASFNRSVYRASDPSARDAIADARTPPMMAALRIVVVKRLEEGSESFFQELEAYLVNPSVDTLLVLTGRGFPKVIKGGRQWSTHISKKVRACGTVRKLGARDIPTRRFVAEQAKRMGRQIGPPAVDLLVALVGDDLSLLLRELEKLEVAVAVGEPFDEQAIADAVAAGAQQNAFDLIADVVEGRPGPAFARVCRMMDDGEPPDKLMGLLLWKARQVVAAAPLVAQGKGPSEVAAAVKMSAGQAAQLCRALSRRRPPRGMVPKIADTWLAMRRDRGAPERKIEALVLDLAS